MSLTNTISCGNATLFRGQSPLPQIFVQEHARISFATFASVARCGKNAKVPADFRAVSRQKPRETPHQMRGRQRRRGRFLRLINGAPPRRTQKQNSLRPRVWRRAARRYFCRRSARSTTTAQLQVAQRVWNDVA